MKNTDKGLVSFFAVVISSFNVPKSIRSDEMIKNRNALINFLYTFTFNSEKCL